MFEMVQAETRTHTLSGGKNVFHGIPITSESW